MSESDHIRIIEVSGQKFEVDLRSAKKVDTFRVGHKVKVLVKDYSGYRAFPGIICGIDAFKKLPTIVVCYIESVLYGDPKGEIKFAYINSASGDNYELCPMSEDDVVPNRDTVIGYFDRAAAVKRRELEDIEARKSYFLRQYGTAFGVGAAEIGKALDATA